MKVKRGTSRKCFLLSILTLTLLFTTPCYSLPKHRPRILEAPKPAETPKAETDPKDGQVEEPMTDQEKEDQELSEEIEQEEEVRKGLIHRKNYAFKELDPENPEMNIKHDLEHDEEGISEMQEYMHIFEDYNYEDIEDQILKRKIELRFRSVMRYYHLKLQQILDNDDFDDDNVGPHLTFLFGDNFEKFYMDFKEIEISIKASLERSVDLFFLYKCADKNFNVPAGFKTCLDFKTHLKRFLMFENFFQIGFYNKMHDMFKVISYFSVS